MSLLVPTSGRHACLGHARVHAEPEPVEVCPSRAVSESTKDSQFQQQAPCVFSLSLSLPSARCVPCCKEVASQLQQALACLHTCNSYDRQRQIDV